MSRTVAIVQARMGSTRLPGKVLLSLAGKTVLENVLVRLMSMKGLDEICCATTLLPEDDDIVQEAEKIGVLVCRGSDTDVLRRYSDAAKLLKADKILRVTSDCPAVDPEVCKSVLNLLDRENVDYASNNMPREWPIGIDCEAFTSDALYQADLYAKELPEREHVTPWMRVNKNLHRANLLCPHQGIKSLRLTLDYPEDYKFLNAIFDQLPQGEPGYKLTELLYVLNGNEEWININNMHIKASPASDYGVLVRSVRPLLR